MARVSEGAGNGSTAIKFMLNCYIAGKLYDVWIIIWDLSSIGFRATMMTDSLKCFFLFFSMCKKNSCEMQAPSEEFWISLSCLFVTACVVCKVLFLFVFIGVV
jgi:hypothetical protein